MLLTEYDEEKDLKVIAEGYKELYKEEWTNEGKEVGRKEGKEKLIKTMLSNGATKETILKLTAISEEEFNKIINS
jgi:hypothetical protein